MSNTIRIRRRSSSGSSGAPGSLENAELAFNEADDTLYYGKGTGGAGGTATTVEAIAGSGAFVTKGTSQTITGNKTFSGTVSVNTPTLNAHAATKGYVDGAISSATYSFFAAGDSGTHTEITDEEDLTITGGTGLSSAVTSKTVTINLDNTSVSAGTYGDASHVATFTVDAQGRLTSAGEEAIATSLGISSDSGSSTIDLITDTLTYSGGTGVDTSISGSTVTISIGQSVGTTDNVTFNTVTANVTGTVSSLSNHSTDNLSEGLSNLYYTDVRVDNEIDNYLTGGTGVSVSSGTISIGQSVGTTDNVTFNTVTADLTGDVTGTVSSLSNHNTDDLTEGTTNRYYSDTLVNNHLSGGTGVTYTNGDISIGQAVGTTDNVTFADATVATVTTTGNASVGGNMTIAGDLTVNGTTTTVNSSTVSVDDKNIELAATASPSDAAADGAGITIKGTTDKTWNWVDATDAWTSSEHINIASDKAYYINGVSVLNASTLGSGVTSSSLTSVGTITTGVWNGTDIAVADGGTGSSTAAGARSNLGLVIGTDVQAYSATLAAVVGGTYTGASSITTLGTIGTGTWQGDTVALAYGGTGSTTASGARINLGLGTIATQASSNVNITGGSISGITLDSVTIDGGTF